MVPPPALMAGAIAGLFIASWACKAHFGPEAAMPPASSNAMPQHIVSMAPSVTEMLFALDLGDRVVGVTRYCNYPDAVAGLPRVGGHFDPNFEAIVRLRPELVVLLDAHRDLAGALHKLGVRTLTVSDKSVEHILGAITTLGAHCNAVARAEALVNDLHARMAAVRRRTADLPRPSVLVVLDRPLDSATIVDAYVAGHDDYFESLIEMAGGRNAYRGPAIAYPVVSVEGIIRIAPEVIIDLAAGREADRDERPMADWRRFPQIDAVAHNRVHALTGDYAVIPGPRFVLLLEALAERIHPPREPFPR